MRRRDLLLGSGLLGLAPLALAATASKRRLVVVLANGGWDVTYTLDPKLGEPEIQGPEVEMDPAVPDDVEEVRTFGESRIVVNDLKRPSVTAFFEAWGPRTVVVNGIWMGAIAHDPCRWRITTGKADAYGPDLTAVVGAELGGDLPLGSLDASGLGIAGRLAASVGTVGARNQLETLLEPDRSFPAPGRESPIWLPTDEEIDLVRAYVDDRAQAHAELWGPAGARAFADLDEAKARAARLLASKQALVAGLVLGQEPALSSLVGTTVSLLAGDVCRAVLLDSGAAWDTHEGNAAQGNYFEKLFGTLTSLMDALDAAGLVDDTLVVVLSEMTRTPKLNAVGGKDHWPHTSAMWIGGPVRGGRTCGATDGLLESLPMDLATGVIDPAGELCRYDNFVAGLLAASDVDPARWLPGSEPFLGALA